MASRFMRQVLIFPVLMGKPSLLRRKSNGKLGLLPLAAVIFFTVSGGPYGVEPLLGYAGEWAIPLLVIVPFLWDVPCILTVLELNAFMPVEGGYYEWVKRGLGHRWAFYEGWWTWLYTFVDLAIYPAFFVQYAAFFFPAIEHYKVPVSLLIIWVNAGLNIRGIVSVGKSSIALSIAVIVPFILLLISGVMQMPDVIHSARPAPSLSLALYTIMWNYIGWDNATTYAGEVEKPGYSYVKATFMAFAAVYFIYLSAIILAVRTGVNPAVLSESGFPELGRIIGGQWLGALLSFGGMASMLGIFLAILLSVSRVPTVMARDRLMPQFFNRLHPRFHTPYLSIVVCSAVVSLLVFRPVSDLLIVDITLYGAGIALEFIALYRLRLKEPDAPRPFRIPLPSRMLLLMFIPALLVYGIALTGALVGNEGTLAAGSWAIAAIISAEAAWQVAKYLRDRKGNASGEAY